MMTTTTTTTTADTFRSLHHGPRLLVLPNCWDAASARTFEALGAPALATTSAGVAWANGYPDGDALPVDVLIATVRAIARVVRVPVSVDAEGGYSDDPAGVAETIAAVVDAGAVGINIEDGSGPPALLASKIERAKQAAARRGVDLFVNARTDVYLRGLVPPAARVAETLARASTYRAAGADGIFVPAVVDPGEIREIAASAGLPMNVLAWPGLRAAPELFALGVRRLSAGSAIAQAALGRAADLAGAFLRDGRSDAVREGATSYAELNALFAAPSRPRPA
jgi:2-methylisocitrate lyase-like PEP mutase family enzyme